MKKISELGLTLIGGQIVQRIIVDPNRGDAVVDSKRKTLVSKSIVEGSINDEGVVVNDYRQEVDEKRLTKEGDIVVKLSAPFYAAMIDKEHTGMLASSFVTIIRDVKGIEPRYLTAFLNSDICQKQLLANVAGSVMSILSNGKLLDVSIPVPSLAKQKEIGEYFEKTIKNRVILEKIIKLEQEKLASLISEVEE